MGGDKPPVGMQYRVDWDGDGKWDDAPTTETRISHAYKGPGTYKISVEAVDLRWQTSSRTGDLFAPRPQTVRVE